MRQLLYVSNTLCGLASERLNDILATARTRNAACDITGLLLYIDGGFLQILEGAEDQVRAVYARISADPRHWDIRLILDREAPRAFSGWSMGYESPCADDPETAGMFAITRDAIQGRLSPDAGKVIAVMLETFYRVQGGNTQRLEQAG